jgi:hypothetical protein
LLHPLELPNLPLEDALQLVHLYAVQGSPKFEPLRRAGRNVSAVSADRLVEWGGGRG